MKKLSVFSMLASLLFSCTAQAELRESDVAYCYGFAELHRQIAIALNTDDPDGDAAWNNARDLCEEQSYSRVMREADEAGDCYVARIAGGWEAVHDCDAPDDRDEEPVSETQADRDYVAAMGIARGSL